MPAARPLKMTSHRTFRTILLSSCLVLFVFVFYLFRPDANVASQQPFPPHDVTTNAPLLENPHETLTPGNLALADTNRYVQAILQPNDTSFPKLICLPPDAARYQYLKPSASITSEIKYFFALNLRECVQLLPRLLGSIVEAIRFLGPEHCALSIVEGNSADSTAEVLAALQPEMDRLLAGRAHFELSNTINPLEGEGRRFSKLAELRNLALRPLREDRDRYHNATVVFINDVAICMEDILELVHQRLLLQSDMVCGMDWVYGGSEQPIFYDSYISRTLVGDLFFNIPPETASYSFAPDLFWNDAISRARFHAHLPVQVFSCWNGAVAFTATPVVDGKVAFRATFDDKGECFQAEPQLFCKDMWFQGHGKIAVVPSVNLAYTNDDGQRIKKDKGYTSHWVNAGASSADLIEWQPPPDRVKCMPTFTDQTWRPWNETLSI
ncbi:cryptococcal mannosyltransferase 1-domain-containing protein [Coniochaeta sp. 2T2.1]|nr:cryptococcal mannosyltransferase 1-domain-containing protein [Coniochaeta sp. 2T2.1]